MDFILWLLLIEDVLLLSFVFMLIYLGKQRLYTLVAFVTLALLILTNILLFQGNQNGFLLILPAIAFIILSLGVTAFASRSHKIQRPRLAKNHRVSSSALYRDYYCLLDYYLCCYV